MADQVVQLQVRGAVVGLFRTNCYIVGSRRSQEAVCIDPGDEPETILALARDLGVRITRVVSTHAHLDHVLAVAEVARASGAPFLMHPADDALARGVPRQAALWLGTEVPPIPEPDFPLADGDDLEVEGLSLRVLHTPGHTPGSVSLYAPGVLFSGDTLFRASIGRTDLPGGDTARIIRSIVERLLALPDETVVLPGHMQETTIGDERRGNPFIQDALAGP
jgi:glyoxylase-like metal-dependent hydrolase (beta-lactamase superfamily II)